MELNSWLVRLFCYVSWYRWNYSRCFLVFKRKELKYINILFIEIKIILADPPGSSLKNRVKYNVCYTDEEAEGFRVRHPFDTVIEGVG